MKNFFQKYLALYLAAVLLILSFTAGLWFGQRTIIGSGRGQVVNLPAVGAKPAFLGKDVDFNLLLETWQIIKQDYVGRGKTLDSEMFYGALEGLVASLGDPYSSFFDPRATTEFSQELSGSFEGIGAEISIKKDQLLIVAALPESPAEKAGLRAGDKILAIDSQPTAIMTLYQAVDKIRGTKGTKVKLLIVRDGWSEPKEFEIVRDEIHFDSVSWQFRPDGLVYLEVVSFSDDTLKLFNQAVTEIITKKPRGIILDLRGNPGGYLDEAVAMASEWIETGPVVLEAYEDRQEPYLTNGQARLKDYKTIVLVNGGSASSSEIVAGALQDYKKASVVGEQTFGKGSVQELRLLSNNSAIKLTIAYWLTPQGRQINETGITPDIIVERTKEDYDNDRDPQLAKAVSLLLTAK
ncbi:MAG: S41 family peptidase [Patescibacteria group bacterium]